MKAQIRLLLQVQSELGLHCLLFLQSLCNSKTRSVGYKTFFMLNSTEDEISTAHKKLNTEKYMQNPK